MMRWAPLILLGLLTACSHTPQWPADDRCAQAMAPSGLLQVRSDRGRHNLVVHREPNAEGITYVALDAIGAPQFTASQTSAGFTVEQSPLYRGVDPQWLLWGWHWWQMRERLSLVCANTAGLDRSEEHTSELQSRGHLVCRLLLEKKNKDEGDDDGVESGRTPDTGRP